jgi:ABC-type sugar transport system ATPase subunit
MGEILLERVTKRFKGVVAVADLNLTVNTGEFVTLLGPSGCGKTTTLNIIAGLESLSAGSVSIDGKHVESLPPHKRNLAFVFQDYALYPHMTVAENMGFGLKMRKTPRRETARRVAEAALKLGLEEMLDRKPRELSGGQRQRVALGRAIVRQPSVFLLDEPLSNLDALLRDETRKEIKRLHLELGATTIYVTHDQEEAMTLSDRIAVLRLGVLQQYDTPQRIYNDPATVFVAGFVGKPRMNLGPGKFTERGRLEIGASGLVVDVNHSAAQGDAVEVGIRPESLRLGFEPGVGANCVEGEVHLVEMMGSVADVTVRCGTELITVRTSADDRVGVGQRVWVDASRAKLHLFDSRSGQRL